MLRSSRPPPRKKRRIYKIKIYYNRKRKLKEYVSENIIKKSRYNTTCIIHQHSWICDIYECKGIQHRSFLYPKSSPTYIS
jgi:hypothetical protein